MGRVSSHTVSKWPRSPGCCRFRGVFWVPQYFVFSMSLHFQIPRATAVSVDSMKRQPQPSNLPTETSRPPIPTGSTISCAHNPSQCLIFDLSRAEEEVMRACDFHHTRSIKTNSAVNLIRKPGLDVCCDLLQQMQRFYIMIRTSILLVPSLKLPFI